MCPCVCGVCVCASMHVCECICVCVCVCVFACACPYPNILLIQVNRFSVSNLHGRPRKNNHPFGIYENIKLGLINYTLLGLIEHHGVFIDSGHYVSYIRQSNKCYHCDDKHITETNLLTLSNNVYLMFYAKEVDIGT